MSTPESVAAESSTKDGVHSEYNLREVKSPTMRGIPLLLFARLLRSSIGGPILRKLKKKNDMACVVRLAEGKLKDWMPLYYPIPEVHDEVRYNKHVKLAEGFDLNEFASSDTSSHKEGDFKYNTIRDYVEKYRSGELTPYQVALAVIKATKASNAIQPKSLNAIVQMKEDDLLQQARESTERYKNNTTLGPLDGVPVALKDEVDVIGYRTTFGTKFIGDLKGDAKEDDTLVIKLRRAGALLVGKANMHECGIGTTGYNWNFGPSRNPHNLNHFTGGSSSGSAAVVAAGIVPLALGFDGGGSIRIPAALCGIVGLKPTHKRCDMDLLVGHSCGHPGPMACSVKDAALGYAILAGPNENATGRSKHVGIPVPPVHLKTFADSVAGLKIGIYEVFFGDAHPEIVETCLKTVNHLESLGAEVVMITLPHIEEVKMAHVVTVSTEITASYTKYFNQHIHKFTPESRVSFAIGQSHDSCTFLAAQKVRRYATSALEDVFSYVDVMISPATGITAPEMPKGYEKYGESNLAQLTELMRYIYHGNLCGIPGVAIPVGYSSSNKDLPISLLIQARHWEEDVIMRVARCCEESVTYKKPAVFYDILEMAKAEPKGD